MIGWIAQNGAMIGWGYQDFASITGTSVTISDNENGDIDFDSSKIINSSAIIVRTANTDTFAYSGTTKLLSTKIKVTAHTGTAVTLNAIPHSTWGSLRIYFLYTYDYIPDDFTLAPAFIRDTLASELNELFPDSFTELSDCPSSYSGQGSKFVAVKADASGLEFVTISSGVTETEYTSDVILQASRGNYWTVNHASGEQFLMAKALVKQQDGNYIGTWTNGEGNVTVVHYDENNLRVYNDTTTNFPSGEVKVITII